MAESSTITSTGADFTNANLKAFIDNFGDRIYCIYFDNGRIIYVNYKDSVKLTDIKLETIGSEDFVAVHHTNEKTGNIGVSYTNYHLTSSIQWIGVMDEDSAQYRVDPLIFR